MPSTRFGIWFLLASLPVLLLGCRKQVRIEPVDDYASVPCTSVPSYFPFLANSGTGEFFNGQDQAAWESNYLQHMREPSLYACGSNMARPEYRFLWDRSLNEPIAVRLAVHPDHAGTLFVRVLANSGMIPPPRPGGRNISWDEWLVLRTDKHVELSGDQTRQAVELFREVFHHPFDSHRGDNTTDGSDWIFESRIEGRYRLRDFRNLPPQSARRLGLLLVRDFAQVPVPQSAIY